MRVARFRPAILSCRNDARWRSAAQWLVPPGLDVSAHGDIRLFSGGLAGQGVLVVEWSPRLGTKTK